MIDRSLPPIHCKGRNNNTIMQMLKTLFITKKLPFCLEIYNFIVTFALSLRQRVLYIMKRSELEKRLRDAGCVLSRHGKKHDKWLNPATGEAEYMPRHASEVATGTAQKILKKLVGA